MRLVTASLIGLLVASPLMAQEPVQEREHVVRKGDTLWDLAGFYFSDPFVWPVIYEANTVVVEDPHWIYPDEVLTIPGLPGRRVADAGPRTQPTARPSRTLFYQEPVAAPRSEATYLSETVRRVPVREWEFASAPYLADPSDLRVEGRMLQVLRQTTDVGSSPTAHPEELVFLEYARDMAPPVGEEVVLVDVGRRVGGAGRGSRLVTPTAVVSIRALHEDVMEAKIEAQFGPVYPGQLVVPMAPYPTFDVEEAEPVPEGYDLEGRILEFALEQPLYGPTEMAFLDLGADDGVSVGDVFVAHLRRRKADEEDRALESARYATTMPPEAVAVLRVVRVMPRSATVKVDQVMLPELQEGIDVRRTRRIP